MSNPANARTKYYGKYRGTVVNNVDPMQIGRVQVSVPDIGPLSSSWALPCLPAGINTGMFMVPPIGAAVWIEFERGDLSSPIWVGGFWSSAAETPDLARTLAPGVSGVTIQTGLGNGIVVSDAAGPGGGIRMQTNDGAMISISNLGIQISNGKGATFSLVGPTVDMNAGALTVT